MSDAAPQPPLPHVAAGERVALGPYRRDLVTEYARWANDVEVRHTLGRAWVASLGFDSSS